MNNVVYLDSFQERFVSGLVFSMLEGLGDGQSIVFSSSKPLDDFQLQLQKASIDGIAASSIKKDKSHWQMVVSRKMEAHEHGCCGMCGGHSKSS
jgi:hypothetical protein